MQIQLITPEKILFTGDANYIQIPGKMGEFGVLPNHAPFISTLREGAIGIDIEGGARKEFHIMGGVAEVLPEMVTLLVEVI